jgi:hypothetical protein
MNLGGGVGPAKYYPNAYQERGPDGNMRTVQIVDVGGGAFPACPQKQIWDYSQQVWKKLEDVR